MKVCVFLFRTVTVCTDATDKSETSSAVWLKSNEEQEVLRNWIGISSQETWVINKQTYLLATSPLVNSVPTYGWSNPSLSLTVLRGAGDPNARSPGYVRYPEGVFEVSGLLGPQKPQRGGLQRPQFDERAGIDEVQIADGLLRIDFVLQHFHHVPLAHYLKSIGPALMDLLRSRSVDALWRVRNRFNRSANRDFDNRISQRGAGKHRVRTRPVNYFAEMGIETWIILNALFVQSLIAGNYRRRKYMKRLTGNYEIYAQRSACWMGKFQYDCIVRSRIRFWPVYRVWRVYLSSWNLLQ